MKKFLEITCFKKVFFFTLFVFYLISGNIIYSQDTIRTTAGTIYALPGQTIIVPVSVTGFVDVASFEHDINFDNTSLTYQGIQNVHDSLGGFFLSNNYPGGFTCNWFKPASSSTIPDGVLYELIFKYYGGLSGLTWEITQCYYSNQNQDTIPSKWINGDVMDKSDLTVFRVNARVLLQSTWDSARVMKSYLGDMQMLPLKQPYDTLPWMYPGEEAASVSSQDITDWVLVELRSAPDTVVVRRAGLLRNDGVILDTNGEPGLLIAAFPGDYHLVVNHRNHLAVMSRYKISFPDTTTYDLTDTLNFPVYGDCVMDMEPGISAMILGDINHDNDVKYSGPNNDKALILQRIIEAIGGTSITSTTQGYYMEDINLNGTLKYSGPLNDPSYIIQTIVLLTGSPFITNVYQGCVPYPYAYPNPGPWTCGCLLTDLRDGNLYKTVQIGSQCWMAENLAYLPSVNPSSDLSKTQPLYYVYNYMGYDVAAAKATQNYEEYGVLYNWPAAVDSSGGGNNVPSGIQGACPAGWHLPADEEWMILEGEADNQYGYPDAEWSVIGYRGTDAGYNLKETGTTHWHHDYGSTNSTGFSGLPGGYIKTTTGLSEGIGDDGYYWTAREESATNAWYRLLHTDHGDIYRGQNTRDRGCAIRCVKDCYPFPSQSDAGPDSMNIPEDSVILMGNTPVHGQGLWTVASGTGGSFSDATSPASVFYGIADITYSLVWTISTNCGSSSDTAIISFASAFPNCGVITDSRDGNTYTTVVIGTQCWMAQNLAYLPFVSPSSAGSNTIPYYYVYDYQGTDVNAAKATAVYQAYGALYNWPAAMNGEASSNSVPSGVQGICPVGWHLPSDEEWKILEGEIDSQYGYPDAEWDDTGWRGTDAGGNLMEVGSSHWGIPNTGATNSRGFTALPGGRRLNDGSFYGLSDNAPFWSSAEHNSSNAWYRILYRDNIYSWRYDYYKNHGFMVRCIKN